MIKEMIPNIRISNDARELVLNCCTGNFGVINLDISICHCGGFPIKLIQF